MNNPNVVSKSLEVNFNATKVHPKVWIHYSLLPHLPLSQKAIDLNLLNSSSKAWHGIFDTSTKILTYQIVDIEIINSMISWLSTRVFVMLIMSLIKPSLPIQSNSLVPSFNYQRFWKNLIQKKDHFLFKLVGPLDSFACKQDVQDELEWWKN